MVTVMQGMEPMVSLIVRKWNGGGTEADTISQIISINPMINSSPT